MKAHPEDGRWNVQPRAARSGCWARQLRPLSHCRNWQGTGSSSKSQVLFYLSERTSDLSRRTPQWDLPLRAVCLPSHLFCHTPLAERARSRVIRQEIQHKFQLECEYSPYTQRRLTPQWCWNCFLLFFLTSATRFRQLNVSWEMFMNFTNCENLWITQIIHCSELLYCQSVLGFF